MPYLKFNKTELINLQYSATKELLRTNRSGSYSSQTISGCNTRKYHGLFVSPIPAFDNALHVLLSTLDISVIQHGREFNFGLHKYEGNHYEPKGHKYLKDFTLDSVPIFTYRVGGVELSVSKVFVEKTEHLLLAVHLKKAHSDTILRMKPMLAFRNIHELTKENMAANIFTKPTKNGVVAKMYAEYPEVYMQTSVKSEFVSMPIWYHNVEYLQEQERGYDYKEDLFSPGYFELPIKVGKTIYFSASLREEKTTNFKNIFDTEKHKRVARETYWDCLHNAAQQFIRKTKGDIKLMAGYPWYGEIPRDTLLASPTLLLENNDVSTFLEIIDNLLSNLEIESGEIWGSKQISVDAPLWLFNTLHQYKEYAPSAHIWNKYGKILKQILNAYKKNELQHIEYVEHNGLLYIFNENQPLTWMNSKLNGTAIVKRYGYVVEICALWYNAICCAINWAKEENDLDFVEEWTPISKLIEENYFSTFSDENHDYLADYVVKDTKNFDFRPNQIIAIGLPCSPVNKEHTLIIKRSVKEQLLTPKGLRTLSPMDANYCKSYEGNHEEREYKAHNGTVYPWLLTFYCETYTKVHNRSIPRFLQKTIANFEEDILNYGIGTIGECFDADPPQNARGAISMATSVAAVLRINRLKENWLATHKIEE